MCAAIYYCLIIRKRAAVTPPFRYRTLVLSKYLISKHIEWTLIHTHINYWLGKTHFLKQVSAFIIQNTYFCHSQPLYNQRVQSFTYVKLLHNGRMAI